MKMLYHKVTQKTVKLPLVKEFCSFSLCFLLLHQHKKYWCSFILQCYYCTYGMKPSLILLYILRMDFQFTTLIVSLANIWYKPEIEVAVYIMKCSLICHYGLYLFWAFSCLQSWSFPCACTAILQPQNIKNSTSLRTISMGKSLHIFSVYVTSNYLQV